MTYVIDDAIYFVGEVKESQVQIFTDAVIGGACGYMGGKGAIRGDAHMTRQVSRFINKTAEKGLANAGSFYFKMTEKYSRKYILPTIGNAFLGVAEELFVESALT